MARRSSRGAPRTPRALPRPLRASICRKQRSSGIAPKPTLDQIRRALNLRRRAGKMTMQVIAAVAEFERDLLVEQTQAGLARARAEGKSVGRPGALTHD